MKEFGSVSVTGFLTGPARANNLKLKELYMNDTKLILSDLLRLVPTGALVIADLPWDYALNARLHGLGMSLTQQIISAEDRPGMYLWEVEVPVHDRTVHRELHVCILDTQVPGLTVTQWLDIADCRVASILAPAPLQRGHSVLYVEAYLPPHTYEGEE